MIKEILKTLKLNHYLKNIIVFIPLLFSKNLFNTDLLFKSILAFVSFCLISSVVYIMNDIIDKENDRKHPVKCNRPIASGRLPIWVAIFVLVILFTISCTIACFIGISTLGIVLMYLLLNIFYSIKLKKIALIDAACIAFGFILRVLAGCTAIAVIPSPLVILLTFFCSMFFTFSKRKLEIKLITEKSKYRASLKDFDENLINQFVIINATLSIAFYFTYVLDIQTIERAGTDLLYITVLPFTLIIFRLLFLINKANNDDPIHFFEKDSTLKILFIIYFIILIFIIKCPC